MESMRSSGEPAFAARVTKVLERHPQSVVGTLLGNARGHWVTPDDPACGERIMLESWRGLAAPKPGTSPASEASEPLDTSTARGLQAPATSEVRANVGDKVVVEITEWPKPGRPAARGNLIRTLGPANAAGQDMMSIIYQFRLPQEFPEAVVKEAEAVPTEVPESAMKDREDWRKAEVITIDPFDAKDFDDAIAVKQLPDGGWELAVHIADVSHYVTPGSALDKEARIRGKQRLHGGSRHSHAPGTPQQWRLQPAA